MFILGELVDRRESLIYGAGRRYRVVSRVMYAYDRTQRLEQRLSGSDHSIVVAL